jgi:hypothetical protein
MFSMLIVAAAAAVILMNAPGPEGPLAGTLLHAGAHTPVVLILPGSAPTDRDGNNPMGVTSAPYRLRAEALAAKAVSSVRIDKRGIVWKQGGRRGPEQCHHLRLCDRYAPMGGRDPEADRRVMRLGAWA